MPFTAEVGEKQFVVYTGLEIQKPCFKSSTPMQALHVVSLAGYFY